MKAMKSRAAMGGVFTVVCRDKRGVIKWTDTAKNLVVNVGLNAILDAVFAGGTQTDPWYIGLTDGTPTVIAGDTMGTHAGWTEVTAYDEAVRQTFVDVRTDQTASNSASKAVFTIDTNATTIGGAFIAASSTKGEAASTLLCGAAFTVGDKSLDDDDTLTVQYDFSAADDGA